MLASNGAGEGLDVAGEDEVGSSPQAANATTTAVNETDSV